MSQQTTDDLAFQTQSRFPYGTFQVAEETRRSYEAFDLSDDFPLPEELPLHHPLLQKLEGRYSVQDALPPWWPDFVEQAPPDLQPLFHSLSIREFREGCIDEKRWRAWKQAQGDRDDLPRSPKLTGFIQAKPWMAWFEERGRKDTPEELDLVISTRPEYLLNMSNGDGWRSCQHLRGGEQNWRLPANWYDTGVAVAMLLPRKADIWEGSRSWHEGIVIARSILRVLFIDEQPLVVMGRCYENNAVAKLNLLSHVIQRCEEHGLSWGTMDHYSFPYLMGEGLMGAGYRNCQRKTFTAKGLPFWVPDGYALPYIDGTHSWTLMERRWYQLQADVIRYLPLQYTTA